MHSAVPVVLHSWGSDNNQSDTPARASRNPALDGCAAGRATGSASSSASATRAIGIALAERLSAGVRAVRDVDYGVEQAMTLYPTSGSSDDYAFSRHFVDPTRTKVLRLDRGVRLVVPAPVRARPST